MENQQLRDTGGPWRSVSILRVLELARDRLPEPSSRAVADSLTSFAAAPAPAWAMAGDIFALQSTFYE